MKYLTILFILIIFACNQLNYKEEFYLGGELKSKVEIDANGLPNGIYKEYYDSGELKIKMKYLSGINVDTIFVYNKNGTLKERGVMQNGLKTGWWIYYDSLGQKKKRNEYIIINNGIYKNQSISYNKEGNIIDSLSSFYNIELPDTLKLGKNTGKLKYNSNFTSDFKNLYVIIDNNYSDLEMKKDTFIETPNMTRFGVFAHKKGSKKIKGTIIEQLLYKKKISKDSSELKVEEHKKYFEIEVYVKDSFENNIPDKKEM